MFSYLVEIEMLADPQVVEWERRAQDGLPTLGYGQLGDGRRDRHRVVAGAVHHRCG